MEKEYQRMMSALERYEKGESKIMATYAEIKSAEKSLLEMAKGNKAMTILVRLLIKTMRSRVREIKLNKLIG